MTSFSDLRFFCEYLVKEYGSPDALSEEEKAEEFSNVYLRNLPPRLRTLKAVAHACGINLNTLEGHNVPRDMRGYHEVFNGKRNIYFKKYDTVSGIENTILHEIREIMESVFTEVCPRYEPLRTIAVHTAANRFASAVLLPKDEFRAKVYETGLDVIALANLYRKSCSQVLLRMGEVLQGKLFFYGALYEKYDTVDPDWRVTFWTQSRNDDIPEANVSGLYDFFPRKGHEVVSGSLVDRAIKSRKPCMVNVITLLDSMDDDGLTAIAQPLLRPGRPGKVALIVLLKEDSSKLQTQIELTKPVTVESFHKHL
jgi:hypothetical protein